LKKVAYCFAQETLFLKESREVHKVLKEKKPADLSDLMSISDKLADLNWKRNQVWKTPLISNASSSLYF
jgi:cytoplasmic iron level regulating protein YaaA (DUF328/UPF0246 family)